MTDPLAICNAALGYLGQQRITEISSAGGRNGDLCERYYAGARDAVLASNQWRFATGWVALSLLSDEPAAEWTAMYSLPQPPNPAFPQSAFIPLAVWEISDRDADWVWAFDAPTGQQVIYAAVATDTLGALVTWRVENTHQWNELAVQALTYKLAADLSMAIAGQSARWQAMITAYDVWIRKATAQDSKNSQLLAYIHSGLTRVRGS